METERWKHENYVWRIKALLSFCGLWIELHPLLKSSLAYAALLSSLLVAMGAVNFCIEHAGNIIAQTEGMSFVISWLTICLKVLVFACHQNDLVYLHEKLSAKYFEDMRTPENRTFLLSRFSLYLKFFWIGSVWVFSTIITFVVISLVAYAKYGKYIRLCPTVSYPFIGRPTDDFTHWILFGFELMSCAFLISVTTGVDCSFGMYSFQMCGELRLLASKFRSLKASADYKAQLRDCIERHQMLYNSKKKLENLFGIIAIWFAITTSIVLCTLMFQLTQARKTTATFLQFAMLILYILVKIMQTFTLTFYGDAIAKESEACTDSIYDSYWPDKNSGNFRKDILIVLVQKPIRLLAESCMFIELDIFAKVLNTSISYFFLLQTLEEE